MAKKKFAKSNWTTYFQQLSLTDHGDVEVIRATEREERDGAVRLAAVVMQPLHHAVRVEEVVGTFAGRH